MSTPPPRGVGERPTPERRGPQGGQGFGPRGMMGGGPAEKSSNFKALGAALAPRARPRRLRVAAVLALGGGSVTLSVLGPRLLGDATNLIFSGVIGRSIPAGVSQGPSGRPAPPVREGDPRRPAPMRRTSPQAVSTSTTSARSSSSCSSSTSAPRWPATSRRGSRRWSGQRSVQRLRAKVQAKLARLPLSYFDRVPHGEILSRVTNDIDNISQTLQQTLSQIVTSLLTIVGVLVMMFLISPLLAVIALVTVPLSIVVATRIGKAAQPHFLAQWATTGS